MAVIAGVADEFGGVGELSRELFSTVNTHMYTFTCTHTGTRLAKKKGEVWQAYGFAQLIYPACFCIHGHPNCIKP